MDTETFLENFEPLADALNGVSKLRDLILQMAVRGRLVPQNPADTPASELIRRVTPHKAEFRRRELDRISSSEWGEKVNQRGRLPKGWEICELRDAAAIEMGNSPPGSSYNEDGKGVPLINGPADFSPDPFGPTNNTKFTTEPSRFCRNGDLLVCVRGATTGRTNVAAFDAAIGRGVAAVHAPEIQGYINLILWENSRHLLAKGKGTTFPSVSKVDLETILVRLPPLPEQNRITSKVDELMALCDQLEADRERRTKTHGKFVRAIHAQLTDAITSAEVESAWQRIEGNFGDLYSTLESVDALRQAIVQLAVHGRLADSLTDDESAGALVQIAKKAKQRELATSGARRQKALRSDNVGVLAAHFPLHWALPKFDDITVVSGGVTKGRKLVGRQTASFPFLRVANVQRGYFDLREIQEIAIPTEELDRYALRAGDILITEGGDWDKVGRTAIWKGQIDPCLHQNHVFKARVMNEEIAREWIETVFNSKYGRDYFAGSSKQTTNLASINMTQLRSFRVPLPPAKEQRLILQRLKRLFELCDRLSNDVNASSKTQCSLAESAVAHQLDQTARVVKKTVTEEPRVKKTIPTVLLEIVHKMKAGIENSQLAKLLAGEGGTMDAKALWKKSELCIDDFYAALKREIEAGLIAEPQIAELRLVEDDAR